MSERTTSSGGESGKGVSRDLRRLKANASASLGELREFLTQTRGRSPQEVLGMVAGSALVRCIGWAVVGTVILLIVGTVGPYLIWGPPKARAAKPRPAAAAPAVAKAQPAAPAQAAAPASAAGAADQPSPEDAKKAMKVMGLGETKAADPNTNPMDKKLDNLLDKLE
ncbi:MAG: hypothetical protein BWX88_01019 [Planctomycetes bacterium ADurb.Bin126]|nr:MAG: hypothetical protein BWX88_01019 [Planctomycetes bacterium ADurb.Bin126]HOD83912.1 hypothetical protein [Phycisphaerae bacterium]HQL74528.1 hypothetical protein [Phycisphaerae bacterium]